MADVWLVITLETFDVRADDPGESSSGGGALCLSFLRNNAAVFIWGLLLYGGLSGLRLPASAAGGQEGPDLGTSGATAAPELRASFGGGLAAAPRNLRTPFIANGA